MTQKARRGNPKMLKGQPSLNPSGRRKAPVSVPLGLSPGTTIIRTDTGWTNTLTGYGVSGRDNRLETTFGTDTVPTATARELWRGDDLAAKVIEALPETMTRQGCYLKVAGEKLPVPKPKPPDPMEVAPPATSGGPPRTDADYVEGEPVEEEEEPSERVAAEDDAKQIQEAVGAKWEELGVDEAIFMSLCYSRAYGGGAVLLGVDDGGAMDLPLDLERIAKDGLRYVTALEADEFTPVYWYDDPLAANFGKPEIYQLSLNSPGSSKTPKARPPLYVHESRLIVFEGIRVSRSLTVSGHGDSVFTRIIRVLRDFNMSWNAVACLVNDFAIAIYKIKNLAEMIGLDGGDAKFRSRMRGIEQSKSILRGVLLDAEGEDYERKSTTLSGLPEILNEFKSRFAAAADMPVTVCFGVSPAGMNATGESDIRLWYDKAKAKQTRDLKPAYEKLAKITMASLGIDEPESWCIEFHPLWQMSDLEKATLRKMVMETDIGYIGAGVVTPEEVGASRWGGDGYSMEMTVDFSAAALEEREANRAAEQEMKAEAMKEAAAAAPVPAAKKTDAFDPDQERDESGRWTSGGGSTPAGTRSAVERRERGKRNETRELAQLYIRDLPPDEVRRVYSSLRDDPDVDYSNPDSIADRLVARELATHGRVAAALQKGIIKPLEDKRSVKMRAEAAALAKPFTAAAQDMDRHQREAIEALSAAKQAADRFNNSSEGEDEVDDDIPDLLNNGDVQHAAAQMQSVARVLSRVGQNDIATPDEIAEIEVSVTASYDEPSQPEPEGDVDPQAELEVYRTNLQTAASKLESAAAAQAEVLKQAKAVVNMKRVASAQAEKFDPDDDDLVESLVAVDPVTDDDDEVVDDESPESRAYFEASGAARDMVRQYAAFAEQTRDGFDKVADFDALKAAHKETKQAIKEVQAMLKASRRGEKFTKRPEGYEEKLAAAPDFADLVTAERKAKK